MQSYKIFVYLIAFSLSTGYPISIFDNKCNDSREYYTTTKILQYNIEYSIITYDNKTRSNYTQKVLYENPTFENYLDLLTPYNNITINGKIIFEYQILAPCYFTCVMEIASNKTNTPILAKTFDTYYQLGSTYPMLCNSDGCRTSYNYCKTYKSHDEL
jgi:hypothetical protein